MKTIQRVIASRFDIRYNGGVRSTHWVHDVITEVRLDLQVHYSYTGVVEVAIGTRSV